MLERQSSINNSVLSESSNSRGNVLKGQHRVHFAPEAADDEEYIVEKFNKRGPPTNLEERGSLPFPHRTRGGAFGGPGGRCGAFSTGRGARSDFTSRGGMTTMMRGGRGCRETNDNDDTENQPPHLSNRHGFGTCRGGMRPSLGRGSSRFGGEDDNRGLQRQGFGRGFSSKEDADAHHQVHRRYNDEPPSDKPACGRGGTRGDQQHSHSSFSRGRGFTSDKSRGMFGFNPESSRRTVVYSPTEVEGDDCGGGGVKGFLKDSANLKEIGTRRCSDGNSASADIMVGVVDSTKKDNAKFLEHHREML